MINVARKGQRVITAPVKDTVMLGKRNQTTGANDGCSEMARSSFRTAGEIRSLLSIFIADIRRFIRFTRPRGGGSFITVFSSRRVKRKESEQRRVIEIAGAQPTCPFYRVRYGRVTMLFALSDISEERRRRGILITSFVSLASLHSLMRTSGQKRELIRVGEKNERCARGLVGPVLFPE